MIRRLFFWAALALVVGSAGAMLARGWPALSWPSKAESAAPSATSVQTGTGEPVPRTTTTAPPLSAGDILAAGHLQPGNAETRLVEVFSLIERNAFHEALEKAENLTRDHPNFHLAHLVRGDLLKLRYAPQATMDAPETSPALPETGAKLAALRTETQARLTALRDRPPSEHIPHQFLALSSQTRHAIAVDASVSRLYLFENLTPPPEAGSSGPSPAPPKLKLVGDFFISVGKSGINKRLEGDGRTPLGAYYITSVRERRTLPAFYGAGALPINYPNALDVKRGRTGSGIWLHGSPPEQYVRAPLASDGCVVLSNPDMERLLATVAPRTTPVVIAERLQWVPPAALQADTVAFAEVLASWQTARSQATPEAFAQLFDEAAILPVRADARPKGTQLLVQPDVLLGVTGVSLMKWQDPKDNMVATFEETVNGQPTGVIRRQYWSHQSEGWRLLQDTVLSGTPAHALQRKPPTALPAPAIATVSTPTPVAAPVKPQPSTPTADDTREVKAVEHAVQAWATAWSQKNMQRYLGAYAPSFDPPGGLSRQAWAKERENRIVYKSRISVSLSRLAISVDGNTATARFVQNYKADALAVSSRKTLKLSKRGNQWLITQEIVGG